MVSGKPSNQSARQVGIPPTTRLIWFFSRTDLWEYILRGRQEYGLCSRVIFSLRREFGQAVLLVSLNTVCISLLMFEPGL
jgi:hypothetical protein